MSLLKNLKLSSAKPAPIADAKERSRAKVLRYLEEQKALAQAHLEGRLFEARKTVYRTNEAGERIQVEAPRHVRRGWFQDAQGTVFFQVRYGAKPLEFQKGVDAVEVGKIDALLGVIETLVLAVQSGELDQQLATAAQERKKNFRRKAA